MCVFLLKSLTKGLFADFFAQKEQDLNMTVDALFKDHFEDAFKKSQTPGSLDKVTLVNLIAEKFQGDENFIEQLTNELEKI